MFHVELAVEMFHVETESARAWSAKVHVHDDKDCQNLLPVQGESRMIKARQI